MSDKIQVSILGRDYAIRSQQSKEQVERVTAFVEQLLMETAAGRTVDTRDLTVLTLLNLAGQHLQLLDLQNQQGSQDSRLQAIVARLEQEVSGC